MSPNEEKGLQDFEWAEEYVKKYNIVKSPKAYIASDGFKLGEWYKSQKRLYKKSNYSQTRFQMLCKAGILLFVADEEGKTYMRRVK